MSAAPQAEKSGGHLEEEVQGEEEEDKVRGPAG
jgi:hypothetical protein